MDNSVEVDGASSVGGLHVCKPGRLNRRPALARSRQADRPVIDVHCHYLDESVEQLVRGLPERPAAPSLDTEAGKTAAYNRNLLANEYRAALSDIDTRLAEMDAMAVDIQVLSPSPTQYYYWASEDASSEMVASQNRRIAEICAEHPDRFIGLGTASLQYPRLAIEQIRYAVKTLGLRGIEISSTINGLPVDHPQFELIWAELDALGATVLLHPLGTSAGPRLDDFYLSNVIGQPLETEIALLRLIYSGHFDRHTNARLCAVHGGGYLPLYVSRADHAWRVRPESCGCLHPPSEYLSKIWFDTLVYDPVHLGRLIETVGIERVVVGSDYPFDMGDYDPVGLLESVPGLGVDAIRSILGENARDLLGLQAIAP